MNQQASSNFILWGNFSRRRSEIYFTITLTPFTIYMPAGNAILTTPSALKLCTNRPSTVYTLTFSP